VQMRRTIRGGVHGPRTDPAQDRLLQRMSDSVTAIAARALARQTDDELLKAYIQLPESMQRAMARQAEAEREKRAKIIAAQGEALAAGELAQASDVMMAHPLALQLRNLQTLVDVAVDKDSTVVFPAPLMSTIAELGACLDPRAQRRP
jgi:hypothetical protein